MHLALKAAFFAVATLLFLCETLNYRPNRTEMKPQWGWLGLAVLAGTLSTDAGVAAV